MDDPELDSSSVHQAGQKTGPGFEQGTGSGPEANVSPATCRELLIVPLLVALADVTLYQARGLTGPAAFFLIAPFLIALGAAVRHWNYRTLVAAVMLAGVSTRLIWCGNVPAAVIGFLLLGCVAIGLAGGGVFLSDVARFVGGLFIARALGMREYERLARQWLGKFARIPAMATLLQFVLPPVAGAVFVGIFVLANPDLASWVSAKITHLVEKIDRWLLQVIESPWRIAFWCLWAWISIGLLRPFIRKPVSSVLLPPQREPAMKANAFYPAFRNTLVLLIGLFAAYLGFEFWTMWAREFPPNFCYSGYAHQGAFWLTVALALTTLQLSAIFRGGMWHEPRLPGLRKMAMLWSAENLLLAAAVFNRLFIYINFNGMTRMRVVGLMGTATVVAGLLLVVVKIWRQHNFAWVLRHQLLTLAIAFYLYVVLPVDALVMAYDVRQIMSGNLRPSVQIAHHLTSIEGDLMLFPLLKCPDPVIREGVIDLLQQTQRNLTSVDQQHWTAYQLSAALFRKRSKVLEELPDQPSAFEKFRDYSFQWY